MSMDGYNMPRRSSISELKIICFQIKEDLLKSMSELQQFRQQLYSHFNLKCKDLEFCNLKDDADFLLQQRRKMTNTQALNPQDNHFFEVSISKLLKYKLQFADKNAIIVLFLQQSKQQVNNNYSLNKKLIDNMDTVRLDLFKYFNSFQDE